MKAIKWENGLEFCLSMELPFITQIDISEMKNKLYF